MPRSGFALIVLTLSLFAAAASARDLQQIEFLGPELAPAPGPDVVYAFPPADALASNVTNSTINSTIVSTASSECAWSMFSECVLVFPGIEPEVCEAQSKELGQSFVITSDPGATCLLSAIRV